LTDVLFKVLITSKILYSFQLWKNIYDVVVLFYESDTLFLLFIDSDKRLEFKSFFLLNAHEELGVVADVKSLQAS
jgi:hypothetical protein